ncbi:MAG TPA: FtsX-like permease family protein [Candidatus Gallacutalibacter stercoravium]|nr:FtsX-like permease family protein [Candidatus Gallacutalibacter stercoravium]
MRSVLGKTTFREIRHSLGRYFAILAIVALGVGFFAGLKVSRSAMVQTGDDYLNQLHFFDYRLISTLGFTQEDVDAIAQGEGISDAEGAVSLDFLYTQEDGTEAVLKAHSITEQVNQLELVTGRMPQNAQECVVDSRLFGEDAVGSVIQVSDSNTEETTDQFAYQSYTITGIVRSPYYLNFERGNTSIGNGTVSGFVYLPYEAFDLDYYTEIFLTLDQTGYLFSDEYDNAVKAMEDTVTELCNNRADIRYEKIVSDATQELEDGWAEYNQNNEEFQTKKKDAQQQLEDSLAQLEEGQAELESQRTQLENTESTLNDSRQQLTAGQEELNTQREEFERTRSETLAQLDTQQQSLTEQLNQVNDGLAQIEAAGPLPSRDELVSSQTQIEAGLDEIERQRQAAQQAYEDGLAQIDAALQPLQAQLEEVTNQLNQIAGTGQTELEQQLRQLKAQLEQGIAALQQQRTDAQQSYEDGIALLDEQQSILEEQLSSVQSGLQALDQQDQLLSAKAQLEDGLQQLADGRNQALAEFASAQQQLEGAQQQLDDGLAQVEDGLAQLESGRQQLEQAQIELDDGWTEYQNAKAEADQEFADAQQQLDSALSDLNDAQQEIDDLEPATTYVLNRDTNVGYVSFNSDSNIVDGIAAVFPIFFFLVAALVCITTMNRMVDEQRTQIGVLKALGYGKAAIMGKYMTYSGSAALIGCIVGFMAGSYLFPKVIWMAYGIMYGFAEIQFLFDLPLALISIAVSLLCSIGATWFSCYQELFNVPAELIRPKAPKSGKRILLERIPLIWGHMKFLHKVSVRNIFRYKKRFVMMLLGISGCTALILTGFGIKDSIAGIANQQFGEIQLYDCSVTFQEEQSETELTDFANQCADAIEGYLPAFEESVDVDAGGVTKSVNLVVPSDPSQISSYISVHNGSGDISFPQQGEAVINEKIAQQLGVQVGDTISARDNDMRSLTLTVSGICDNYVYNYLYVSPDTLADQWGEQPEPKTVYVNLNESRDLHEAAAELMAADGVSNVSINADTASRVDSMMVSLNSVIVLIITSAGMLAFIVLYNLTNINITERVREIATIKVLGFNQKETGAYVFRENLVLTAIGALVGLPLGRWLHAFVMNQIQIDMVSFDIRVEPMSYIFSVALTFAFACLVAVLMYFKLDKINMAESLKSVD